MADKNYWKNIYQNSWQSSSDREIAFAKYLEEKTGLTIEITGLGAGSTDYISGSAEDNGMKKGDPDLHVVGTNVFIEITGPLSGNVKDGADIWFRPDKLNNAYSNCKKKTHDTFLANNFSSIKKWYIIHVDDELCARMKNNEFSKVYPIIRGVTETYVSFPSTDKCICSLDFLVDYLINVRKTLNKKLQELVNNSIAATENDEVVVKMSVDEAKYILSLLK